MKNFKINTLTFLLAFPLSLSINASAEGMSKDQYKLEMTKISAEYKYAKTRCDSLAGNAEDICDAQEKGKRNIAKAELEQSYTPTVKTRYDLHVARAEAEYAIAIQKCDDKAGNAEPPCGCS